MPADELCSTVDDNIETELNRSLEIGAHKGIIYDCEDPSFPGNLNDSSKVSNLQKRIGGGGSAKIAFVSGRSAASIFPGSVMSTKVWRRPHCRKIVVSIR